MKKTNFILAFAGFVLFFFLGVQDVSAQSISAGSVSVEQQQLDKALAQTTLVSEANAAIILKEEVTNELQAQESGAIAETTQALRVHYYQAVINGIAAKNLTVKQSISDSIAELNKRSYDFKSRTAVDYNKIVDDTVALLEL